MNRSVLLKYMGNSKILLTIAMIMYLWEYFLEEISAINLKDIFSSFKTHYREWHELTIALESLTLEFESYRKTPSKMLLPV